MIPWEKCSKELQRALLALVLLSASKTATGCVPPMVCDPAPPPSMTPLPPGASPSRTLATATPTPTPTPTATTTPGFTPMICDPAPPPSRTPGFTPMVCDPAPPPSRTPTRTPMVCDPPPPPKTPMICDPPPAPHSGLLPPLAGRAVDQAASAGSGLPLAEIRSVRIVAQGRERGAWTFDATSPWPQADYRWSASGGRLAVMGQGVTWQPPDKAGRYLVQVIADWGRAGLAVDAVVLALDEQGHVTVG